jgi:hypothetical protein
MLFNILLSNIINVSLTYLRGLEVPELKEEDMPMAIDKQSSEANKD